MAKKASKKAGKKIAKKALKKATKKVGKKASKKASPKAAKKPVKKVTKKVAKKATKKASPKMAPSGRKLSPGQPAPDFSLLDQNGKTVSLKDFRGKNVVVYFYPKALTPGCTVQACGLRDVRQELEKLNVVVLGISPDAPKKLKQFEEKKELNFTLLSDEDHKVAESYGCWGLKKFMGREFMGVLRQSFFLDSEGRILEVLDKVDTGSHHDTILKFYQSR
jgi:peroxiredoxin Q/BCP